MKNKLMVTTGVAAFVAAATMNAVAAPNEARRAECAQKAEKLVAQMTDREKIAEAMMDSPAIDRLGIPRYHWWNEALHGVARAGLATVFPQSVALGATFDEDLVRRVGDVVSTEARAKYNLFSAKGRRGIYCGLTFWSPNVNMFRDPRWGRGQETFGEDPFLSGLVGAAYVRGLQGDDPRYLKVAACAKHYAVHSGPERLRHGFNAKVSQRDLAEYYLPAFKRLVTDAKVESVMGAYSAINGVPCCANRWLLNDLLRGAWGFKGHIVSDVGAVHDIAGGHHFRKTNAEASEAAIAAGLDLCSEGTYGSLNKELAKKAFAAKSLDASLKNLFTTRALLGQFDPAGSTPWDKLGAADVATPAARALALEAAEKSVVLISNNGILPLDASKLGCIGIGGPRALDEVALLGNYCGYTDRAVSVFSGLVGEAGPGVRVMGAPEHPAGDVIVVCLGLTAEDEGEEGASANNAGGDRAQYGLPKAQINYLRNIRRHNRRVIAVVFGGSPIDLDEVKHYADAVLLAWYPGEQGGRAIARLILGKANPSGRLPITLPKSYADLPPFQDYALAGRTYRYATKKPAYPFGYGLSYSTFAYRDAKAVKNGGKVEISVKVKNVKGPAGEEVVQCYLRAPQAAADRRLHHLEGVCRVKLAPGEEKTVTVALDREQFAVYGEDGKSAVPAGETTVFVGGGQPGFATCVSVPVVW